MTKKLRIGIITYHRFINYGALFQAYGLSNKLNEFGSDAELIEYRCDQLENVGNSKMLCKGISYKRRIWKLLFWKQLRKKEKLFDSFIEKNLRVSDKKYYNVEELKQTNDVYDLFITGSDQVWNSKWPHDRAYFLDFVDDDSKKMSYAASLGDRGIPNEKREFYREKLKNFKCLSVREENDKELISEVTGRQDVDVCVDPVFLLDKLQWQQVAKPISTKEKYVIIYTVNEPEGLMKKAEKYAKEIGAKMYYMAPSFIQTLLWHKGKKLGEASPEEFLGYFMGAEAVFTNSFHGTVFGLIFQKNLYVETVSHGHKNQRATDILERLGLEKNTMNYLEDMEYPIEQLKEKSIQYIKQKIMQEEL